MRLRFRTVGTIASAVAITLVVPWGSAIAAPADDKTGRTETAQHHPGPQVDQHHRDRVITPTLTKRATLSADYQAEGPPSGAAVSVAVNGRKGPFPGQVVPGFSGMIDNGDGTFWALPDNGFGRKDNSADFLLRLYLVKPAWETAKGGPGAIEVLKFISLQDPDHHIDFPLVHEDTRLLTGSDFDIESVVRGADGSFWIGDEFGPFLLHVSAEGRVLSAPVPLPAVKSPDNPELATGETALLPRSRGFEAMAASRDGRRLYPILEGALTNDPDQRRRLINEFDVRHNRYTGRTWSYQTDREADVVGDAYLTGKNELLLIERDDFDGPAAVIKRIYRVNLNETDHDGFVKKSLVVDLLKIANPDRIGTASSPGAYGIGDEFSFPFQSVETVVPLRNGSLLLANDNNYPNNSARYPGRPDDTEMVVIDLRRKPALDPSPTLIAHRGASGYRPEHTLAAYELAIRMCADYIEPDVVSTKDGVLVARHENEISGTTNVSTLAQFADRKTTKTIDGLEVTGWFTEDFTLAELKTVRAKERLPLVRPGNTAFDGLYEIPTIDEVADLARHSKTCSGQQVGVYPETKHPTYFQSIGLPLEGRLLGVLAADGFRDANDPVFIQSFETSNLKALNRRTDIRLVQLVDCTGAPYDLVARGDSRTYADLVTRSGLRKISRYADGVGLCKDRMIPRDAAGNLTTPTAVIGDAHDAGLEVVGWTFRRENQFLPAQFRSSSDPARAADVGDLAGEIQTFLDAGMDGFFTDDPDIGYQVLTT